MSKRLLVNADDFGLSEGITDGIIEAHKSGIVTSTSIVAAGKAFAHACKQASTNQRLGIGIHLTLVEELPVSRPQNIATLVQPSGRLPRNYTALLSGLLLGRIRTEDIEREFRAQIAKCLDAGLKPTHLDSHQHVHTLPSILRVVIRLGEEFDIRGLRLPRDFPRPAVLRRDGFLQKTVLCAIARWDTRYLPAQRFAVCDRMAGLFESGGLSEAELAAIVEQLPEGTTELVCHPGLADTDSKTSYGHWHYNWQSELNALTSPAIRDLLAAYDVELVSYRDLQKSSEKRPSPISSAGPVR